MTVTTNDYTTLKRLAREGVITNVKLIFDWQEFTWMYQIETTI